MLDQAEKLRRLVMRTAASATPRDQRGPRLLVVSGGKHGVGATTIAVNLAVALAKDALRVVLVDADFTHANIAAQAGLSDAIGIGDVLAGRKSVHEAIQRGPAGLQIIAGLRSREALGSIPERISGRVLRQFQSLAPHADWVVVDAGHQSRSLVSELWSAADHVLLATSPDAVAVMDTYALMKTLLSSHKVEASPALVVNHAENEAIAADVHRRIDQSCRRFLGMTLEFAAALPADPLAAAEMRRPAVLSLSLPKCPLAVAIQRLAEQTIQSQTASYRDRMAA